MTSYKNNIIARASAIVLAACISANLASAAFFGFEDVTDTHTASSDFWASGSGSVSTVSNGVTASLSHNFFYESSYSGYVGGAGVSASASNAYDDGNAYAADFNSAPGGASQGSKYAVFCLPSQTNTATTQYNYEYANDEASGLFSYVTPLDGKNTLFDKTQYVGGAGGDYLPYTSILFDSAVRVNSVDLALTSILFNKLDSFSDAMIGGTIHTLDGKFITLRIYGVLDAQSGTLTDNYVDWIAAKYVDGTNDILSSTWNSVSLERLGENVEGLALQCVSNIGSAYGITFPAYIAMDNLAFTAVPEPSTYAAIFGLAAFALALRRKFRR